MNKAKIVGKGFIYGLRHPFTEFAGNRYDNMTTTETFLDILGSGLGQGLFHAVYGPVTALALLAALGYVNKLIEDMPVKVKMIIDK